MKTTITLVGKDMTWTEVGVEVSLYSLKPKSDTVGKLNVELTRPLSAHELVGKLAEKRDKISPAEADSENSAKFEDTLKKLSNVASAPAASP